MSFNDHDRRLLTKVLYNQYFIIQKLNQMANTLADLQAEVTAEDTVVDSAITLLNGLAAQVAALKPDQAAIDALAADVAAKTKALADAIVANTPAQ